MMTFRQKTILIATVLMGFVGTVFSQSVTLSVDQNTITLGESLSLQVKVAGSRDSTEPVISNMDNFEIESSGTSSQIQIINGTTTVSKVFQYMATPKKEGVFQIGPAVIEVSGVKFQSRAVNITVSKSPTHQKDAPYRVKAFVDNSSPFVHEQIVYVFQFLTRVQLANAKLDAPKFSDFWKEDLGKEREYQMTDQGISWSVTEVRYALFPNRAGILKIEPTVLSAAVVIRSNRQSLFDSFFDDP
ncbi:MAG: BatD family protein, partial [Bdellovibrionales bacterium]|nr:BatD family protein [Bdellovibrionales bacterium]